MQSILHSLSSGFFGQITSFISGIVGSSTSSSANVSSQVSDILNASVESLKSQKVLIFISTVVLMGLTGLMLLPPDTPYTTQSFDILYSMVTEGDFSTIGNHFLAQASAFQEYQLGFASLGDPWSTFNLFSFVYAPFIVALGFFTMLGWLWRNYENEERLTFTEYLVLWVMFAAPLGISYYTTDAASQLISNNLGFDTSIESLPVIYGVFVALGAAFWYMTRDMGQFLTWPTGLFVSRYFTLALGSGIAYLFKDGNPVWDAPSYETFSQLFASGLVLIALAAAASAFKGSVESWIGQLLSMLKELPLVGGYLPAVPSLSEVLPDLPVTVSVYHAAAALAFILHNQDILITALFLTSNAVREVIN